MSERHKIRPTPKGIVRCAIYTRKSSEEGLEQEFNSLDAQRESAEAYIRSQKHDGWVIAPDVYDDGGFTGGNMERPELRRLISDIENDTIDCVVVYKVDRLSRSLLDFARLMGLFDKHHVAFVTGDDGPRPSLAPSEIPSQSSPGRRAPHSAVRSSPAWCLPLGSESQPQRR
jgi:site-specific DNA recombinase